MTDNISYEASFRITNINNAKYDRVSRIRAVNESSADTELYLDVNTELYPVDVDDRVTIALAETLNLDGSKDEAKGWRNVGRGEQTLADEYDYVCHGKVYRFDEGDGQNIKVYISFGGLLMLIDGPYSALSGLRKDHVYLLMKK